FPPELTNTALVGEFTLEFTIDEDGFVRDPGVTSSTHADMDGVVLEAIGKFRYAPRFVEGKPVPTEGMNYTFSVDFSRSGGKNNFLSRPPLRGFQSGSKSMDDPFSVGGGGKGGGK
ncbi:MAG: energy transducer TonB, partial [Gammaproteobacteria bacterium]|nr:energy transducer TonB [Gammaproteobacteria bacterium]